MKKTVIWLLALLLLCTAAHAATLPAGLTEISEGAFEGDMLLQGVLVLPEGTQTVGERAFADTDVHALVVPAGCALAPDVLSGAEAAYIRLAQYVELDGAVLDDVGYVFVDEAAEDAVLEMPYILTSDTLTDGGMIYLHDEDGLYPLCAADRTALPETVAIPKQIGGQPVIGLDMLLMPGSEETELLVPAYMEIPEGLDAAVYATMSAVISAGGTEELMHDTEAVFEAIPQGEYGAVTVQWTFTLGEETDTIETAESICGYMPASEGLLTVAAVVTDELGDTAQVKAAYAVRCGAVHVLPLGQSAVQAGQAAAFTAEAVCGCLEPAYAAVWTVTYGEEAVPVISESSESLTWSFVPELTGMYAIAVQVTDAYGNTAFADGVLDVVCGGVTAEAPIADVLPALGTETVFTVNAACDCDITGYVWTITDGTNTDTFETTEPSLPWTPFLPGGYTLTVTAADAVENTAEASLAFTVPCRGVTAEAPIADVLPALGTETVFTVNAACDCGITGYIWTITDGTSTDTFETTEPSLPWTPSVPGSYTLTVTVTDAVENTAEASLAFTVPCRGVTAEAPIADVLPALGMETVFTVNAACDCDIIGYVWTITDGANTDTFETTEPSLPWTPSVPGSYTLTVTVTDAVENTAEASLAFTVPCRGVTAEAPIADVLPALGTETVFTVNAACDCDIIGYVWTITDGANTETFETTEPSLPWTPSVPGGYTLTVTVTDAVENTAAASLAFTVPCRGVTASLPTPETDLIAGVKTNFIVEADCDCAITVYHWTFVSGTETTAFTTTEGVVAYTPATVGAFTVTVVIEDASGAALTVETTCEAVCGVQVTAPVTTDEPAIGTEMTFTTGASCGCEIVSYTWVMTDTVQSTTVVTTEPVLTFTPQYADIFTLTVTAEDSYGEMAQASCGFTVPCAGMTLGVPEAVDGLWLGEASVLSVPASCDCIAMYYYWMIQTEDTFFSVLTTEPVLSYTPETAQPHQVMVSVTDALGNNETVEATIGISCSGVTVLEPEAESEPVIGAPAVFVTEALCDCEIVSYAWTITDGDLIIQETTQEPVFTYTPVNEKLVVSVTATDALGGYATACTEYTLADYGEPVYRAVLIGNTYPDTDSELAGCDTDVYAMRSMLRSMTGTPFTVTARTNQTASGIQSAISSAFAGADANDVSLFYYSGHGTSTGMLVGTSGTYVAAANLRTWLDQVPGTKIVILDCCYSGMTIAKSAGSSASGFNSAIISAFSWVSREGELATNGYYVLTACSKNQKSLSLSDGTISFGAFTYSLCYGCGYDEWNQEALSGMPADDNGDGAITISEAISGIRSRISYLSSMVTLNQAMQYYGDTSYTLWSK